VGQKRNPSQQDHNNIGQETVYPAGYVRPGGVRWDLSRGFSARCLEVLDKVGGFVDELVGLIYRNPVFRPGPSRSAS